MHAWGQGEGRYIICVTAQKRRSEQFSENLEIIPDPMVLLSFLYLLFRPRNGGKKKDIDL